MGQEDQFYVINYGGKIKQKLVANYMMNNVRFPLSYLFPSVAKTYNCVIQIGTNL